MSLVESVRSRLLAGLSGYASAIVLDPPTYGDENAFAIDDTERARIKRVVYVYESTDGKFGPYQTSSVIYVHLACYAPTIRECTELEKRARTALFDTRLGEESRVIEWFDARGPVEDRGYDPPELYALGRYRATGLWGAS